MTTQTELQFDRATERKRRQSECAYLIAVVLDHAKDWMTRDQLAAETKYSREDVRRAGEMLPDRIVFGQKGYKSVKHATLAEIQECRNQIMSQVRRMMEREVVLARVQAAKIKEQFNADNNK